jgi:hypothetical protein
VPRGPTGPSALGEARDPSARSEPSFIVAELAGPYQEDKELWRRNQELENVQNQAVTATVIVETSGAGDHDQNAAASPFGREDRRVWLGATLALLLVVGVILGVTIPLPANSINKGTFAAK